MPLKKEEEQKQEQEEKENRGGGKEKCVCVVGGESNLCNITCSREGKQVKEIYLTTEGGRRLKIKSRER